MVAGHHKSKIKVPKIRKSNKTKRNRWFKRVVRHVIVYLIPFYIDVLLLWYFFLAFTSYFILVVFGQNSLT